jgi:transcription initiation factor TFIIE subunit alpha
VLIENAEALESPKISSYIVVKVRMFKMGDVQNEVDHRLLFMDNQTLMKVVALFGDEAVKVIQVLKGVNEVTDKEIADKTQINIHVVRKVLYKLYDHSLVVPRRSRDKETRWFVYHWRLQPDQFAGLITSMKPLVLERLKTRLRYEMNHEFYSCQTPGCKRYTFEEAIEILFKCPICHKPMIHLNNDLFISVLTEKIEKIEKELTSSFSTIAP